MQQTTIFDMIYGEYKIQKPIRLIEFFAGYGSQALALKYLGVNFEHWKICEWAVKSIQAYKDIHYPNVKTDKDLSKLSKDQKVDALYKMGISSNYNDPMTLDQIKRLPEDKLDTIIENIIVTNNLVNIQQAKGKDLDIKDTDKYDYILTYSFPCQDLSLAGKGKGMADTSTRSGMLWEVERILKECQEIGTLPQVLLMENVPQVHGKNNLQYFQKWQKCLEELGYKNFVKDLIATDYGIPQTRNRCFMVSILGERTYKFPEPIELKLKLKDMLEDNVDEKYYLSEKQIERIKTATYNVSKERIQSKDCCSTLCARDYKDPKCVQVASNENLVVRKYGLFDKEGQKRQAGSVYDKEGLCPTLDTMQGGYRQPCIEETNNTDPKNINLNKNLEKTLKENKLEDGVQYIDTYNNKVRKDGLASTITTRVSDANGTYIAIKNNTKKGYLEAKEGDGVNICSLMEHQRGNVQKEKIQTLTTSGGNDRGVVLKKELCNMLIEQNKVEEGDVIKHSYTQKILDGEKKCVEKNDGNMITLTTRADCVGVCVKDKPNVIGNYMPSGHEASRIIDSNSVAPTVKENHGTVNATMTSELRIRKLTPKECFRLMGVKDEDYERVAQNQSNSSLYHLAGDSIVVNVLMAIFKQMMQ